MLTIDRVVVTIFDATETIVRTEQATVEPGQTVVTVQFFNVPEGNYSFIAEAFSGEILVANDTAQAILTPFAISTINLVVSEVGLIVNPGNFVLTPPGTQQLTATRGGGIVTATWNSSDNSVATVDANGLVTAIGPGSATITAGEGGDLANAIVTVIVNAVLQSIAITPATVNLNPAGTQALTATGSFSNDTMANITNTVTWSSGNPAVATVSATGVVTAVAVGSTQITASRDGVMAMATVNVTVAGGNPIAYILITNPTPNGGGGSITSLAVAQDGTLSVLEDEPNTGRPQGIATNIAGTRVYTANALTDTLAHFNLDLLTGLLDMNGANIPAPANSPQRLVVDPTEKFVFVSHFFGQMESYTIGTDGRLTLNAFPAISADFRGPDLEFNSTGTRLYVPTTSDDTITVFNVNQTTGELTFLSPGMPHFPVDAGDQTPADCLLSTDGNRLFVCNNDTANIRNYPLGVNDEPLNGGPSFATDPGPNRLARNRFLSSVIYVACASSIQAVSVAPNGTMSALGAALPINGSCRRILLTQDGNFLYSVASNEMIDAFAVSATGELTFIQTYNFSELSFPADAALIDTPFF